ncbi:MAG: ABC transporter permease [Anaerolineales bacterium]
MTITRFRYNLRMVLAIASKDIIDAFRNRTILMNLGLTIVIVVIVKLAPTLWKPGRIDITVYDPVSSGRIADLEKDPDIRVFQAPSFQAFNELMDDGDEGPLGLVIPEDFDGILDSGKVPEIDGYLLWEKRASADSVEAKVEGRLEEAFGSAVDIQIVGMIYPEPGAMGSVRTISLILVVGLFYVGILTLPHLMIEEKQTKTVETLLISPASIRQVVMGKALAGLAIVLSVAILLLVFNWTPVIHWWLALLGLLSGALLSVGLGLLMGLLFENRQQLNTWTMIIFQPLLIPLFLSVIDPLFPEGVRQALYWFPTAAVSLLLRYSFTNGATMVQILTSLGVVVGSAFLVFALVVWKVRRMDR